MIRLYILTTHPKEHTIRTNDFTKVAEYKTNTQKSLHSYTFAPNNPKNETKTIIHSQQHQKE